MSKLSIKELDLLNRIQTKPELEPLFFRKAKGLKWFNALCDAGYFNAQNIPKPVPAKQEGYINIPRWEISEYLVKTASELMGNEGSEYAPRFLNIISDATAYAKEHEFGNYHVWGQFAQLISKIPSRFISTEFLDVIDYWLNDKYGTSLVADEIGEKWLVTLLEEGRDSARNLSVRLLEILYKVNFIEQERGERKRLNTLFRFDHYHADKITKKVAFLAGRQLGPQAMLVFRSKLEETLATLGNDTWSAIWQPAIEEHEQNKYRDNPENVLVEGCRECLNGYFESEPEEACAYVGEMIESPFQTIQRLAIYFTTHRFLLCEKYTEALICQNFLNNNYRHEIWHFINSNYTLFNQNHKDRLIKIIKEIKRYDENGVLLKGSTAYEQATWLAAIKDFGVQEKELYREAVALAKTEPDHPDFSTYLICRKGGQESPYSVEELSALSVKELVHILAAYKGDTAWAAQGGIEELAEAVKQLIKASPSRFYADLTNFTNLDLAYVYSFIEAYSELWKEKANLPWDDIWHYLLEYCSSIVRDKRFWNEENSHERKAFVANRYWIVGSIGRLLKAGAKSDEHAFHEKYHDEVEALIAFLLQKEKGEEFQEKNDAVTMAINSPRGQCIEALINLTLRLCRLSDRENNRDHSGSWAKHQHYYDSELRRSKSGGYEFSTLVTNYLPNFLYMSKDWVRANLERIFDQTNYLKWLCAMQGYSYVGVYQEIYLYLREHGDLLKSLDDGNIKNRVMERIIQHIVVAYLNDFENLTDRKSLIRVLINRKNFEELNYLIWFVRTLRKEENGKQRDKVYQLWTLLMGVVDFSTRDGKKLASTLCQWAAFVDQLDEERKKLLLAIAPYADESYNSYELLESIANLSNKQPYEVHEIWLKILEGSSQDYPEEAIRQILLNLVTKGAEGKRRANDIVSEYLKLGVESPSIWLREIIRTLNGV